MLPLISDAQFLGAVGLISSAIAIIPATLAAIWARSAKQNSSEAMDNSAGALHEVKANGGMSDPDPTLKDYIKFVGENVERLGRRMDHTEGLLDDHLKHSKVMDAVLAEVFFVVKPDLKPEDFGIKT